MSTVGVKHVLFVSNGRPFGGAEVYTGRLVELLRNDIKSFAVSGSPELSLYLRGLGVQVIRYTPFLQKNLFRKVELFWKLEYLLVCACLLPYLRVRYRIDAVWMQGFREAILLPWARLTGYKVLATTHNTVESSLTQNAYPYLLLSAHKVVCVSQTVANTLPGFLSHKTRVIHNWASAQAQARPQQRTGQACLKLLYVGRLVGYKGAALLIEAVRRLAGLHGSGAISLEIVGDGPARRELQTAAVGLNVNFAGFQADPSGAYRRSDAFVNPTFGPEGSPLVSLEAMSHGLPLVLSDLPVNCEISRGGLDAKLFERGNVEDLVARIQEMLESGDELATYSRRASAAFRERFSEKIALESYRKLLKDL